ncbi:hypothetical protein B0H10DRAFT_2040375 [Mycena sp. CBHHK59/15]|nr:hypothetical protein B0H10DRAFT_2040375 [Mycena sp. CBHHK59/15]
MRSLAQELIDAIIDNFDFSSVLAREEWRGLRKTLRACSLVNSAFRPRSQFHILSAVTVFADSSWSFHSLSRLLRSSAHIGPYIRRLGLEMNSLEDTQWQDIAHIVSCTANLIHVRFGPWNFKPPMPWHLHPAPLRTSLLAAFSLPSLRSIDLQNYTFSNPPELASFLCHCTGLKELGLDDIAFADKSPSPRDAPVDGGRITLDSLTLKYLPRDVARFIFDTSIILAGVQANSRTLQEIRSSFPCSDEYSNYSPVDPAVLKGETPLRSIHIYEHTECFQIILEAFGLDNMNRLRSITLRFCDPLDPEGHPFFAYLDAQCRHGIKQLAEVNIYACFDEGFTPGRPRGYPRTSHMNPSDIELVSQWLPYIAGKGFLHVYRDDFDDEYDRDEE